MPNFIDESILKLLKRANLIILIGFIIFCVVEFAFNLPGFIYQKLSIRELLLVFLYAAGFYSLLYFLMGIFVNIVILGGAKIANKKRYYFTISIASFTMLNYVPVYLIFSAIIDSLWISVLLSLAVSISIAHIISNIIFHAYNEVLMHTRNTAIILSVFFVIIILFSFYIINKHFYYDTVILSYYFFLILFLIIVVLTNIFMLKGFEQIDRLNLKYVLLPFIIIIAVTALFFPSDKRIIAVSKTSTIFEKNIIHILAYLTDIDRDGFAPPFLTGGRDRKNFNPDITPLMFDFPENNFDENNFNGDLMQTFYAIPEEKIELSSHLKNYNLLFIIINNASFKSIDEANTPFLMNLIKRGVFFNNTLSAGSDKVLSANSVFNSNITGVSAIQRTKPLYAYGRSLFEYFTSCGYKFHGYFDIPYSYNNDIFFISEYIDVFYANNKDLSSPINIEMAVDDLGSYTKNAYLSLILLEGSIASILENRFKKLYNGLDKAGKLDRTLMVIMFLPEINESRSQSAEPLQTPVLFFYKGINPFITNDRISGFDILPTILDLFGFKYDIKSYKGRSRAAYMEGGQPEATLVLSLAPDASEFMLLYKDYKLIYSPKRGFEQIYNIKDDPEMKKNIINKDFADREKMFSMLDFYMTQGSK